MLRKVLWVGGTLVAILVAGVAGTLVAAEMRWQRTFTAPEPEIRASADPETIARGRYLAYGPAHCAACHTPNHQLARVGAGEELPLVGGHVFALPFGTVRSPNLTPDPETGIGRVSDAQLARMLRHGIRRDGRAAIPFMETRDLSDEDVTALISFLRAQEPVRNAVPDHEYNAVGRTLLAFLIEPRRHETAPPARSPAEAPTVERGAYLANSAASCVACHTQRSPVDGSESGPRFAGGIEWEVEGDPEHVFVPPNLTPDPRTGRITGWTEDQFVARFRAGRVYEKSHMPWGAFGRMSDDDLRAIYRYLRSLAPVENETGPSFQRKAE